MKRSVRRVIKESVDNLPAGICFADLNGMIVLSNRQMNRLCHMLMGTDLQNIDELRTALKTPKNGAVSADPGSDTIRFDDGRVWMFRESEITAPGGRRYIQMQTFDVSELHEKRSELERENEMLEETNARAKRLYEELDRTVREEETFAMKMRIHDDIGLCLLTSRKALRENCTLAELRETGVMWQRALDGLGEEDGGASEAQRVPDSTDSALCELIVSAGGIGIKIMLDGELPESAADAYLLITAMRECATNAVRHAGGSEMRVRISTEGGQIVARITNNGEPPHGEITEGGGLSGLRRRVESAGGRMSITSSPEFELTIVLPGRGRAE